MKKYLITVMFGLLCITESCHFGTYGAWKNASIDGNVRSNVSTLNKQLFKNIMDNDVNGVKKIMSQKLLNASGNKIDTIVNTVSKAFHSTDYDILDEYYSKNSNTNITNTLFPGNGNHNDYKLQYLALNEEMYVSLLKGKGTLVNCLILAIYGKYGNEWKLNILQVGEYELLDKTGPDYYSEAVKEYDNGDIINASLKISMVPELANPAERYFKYDNEEEMKSFYSKVLKEANTAYKFPITIDLIKTKPQIFAINPQVINEKDSKGIYPLVKYKTVINLKDTIALKAENDNVQKATIKTFRGIANGHDGIIYQAFNQIPDGKIPVEHYGFIQKLK